MQPNIKIIYSPQCLEYGESGHPESPDRVGNSYQYLKKLGYEFIKPEPASETDILLVHSSDLVNQVKENNFYDPDTPNIDGIFAFALLSVGAAIKAVELVLNGEITLSLMRPPGHHATHDKLGGFCYFNNIAIAVKKIINKAKRIAIIDIDCHHGQGTQDIFQGDDNVLYVSLHQRGIYPGTGLSSGDNYLNYPLDVNTGPEKYLAVLRQALIKVKEFKPKLLAISTGFDTYKKDPLTGLALEIETYKKIGQTIAGLELPFFAVLEGGYSQDMPQCLHNFLKGLEKKI
jgi:acetoin utilization deacetylase AcuC-like enzyme